MAGRDVFSVSDDELFELYPPNVNGGLTPSPEVEKEVTEEDSSNSASKFDIESSWLVNPSYVKIIQRIAEGPNSTVYSGLYKSKPVAVKIVESTTTPSVLAERKEKFHREVWLLSKVKHENIVKFIGACFEPSMMILSELMMGGTIQKHLWDIRPETLDLRLSISFALDICRAMEYLHENGFIHRDLKPANLLLTEDLKQIKLADFGHAREEISGAMTSEAGTYRWMAPELFSTEPVPRGTKKLYDHKADVYSFSIVLWELITNETPFKGRNNIMVAYATAKRVRPSLDEIPEELSPLLESCWAQDPKSRPEFKEIKDHLSNFYQHLCSNDAEPPNNVVDTEAEHQERNMKDKEAPVSTSLVIDRPQEKTKAKRRKKGRSLSFIWCFACKCLSG